MNLRCSRFTQQSDNVLGGLTADDGVVNDDDPFALYVGFERGQLGLHQALFLGDARADLSADIFILHETHAERDA